MRNHLNSMSEAAFRVVVLTLFVAIFTLTLFMLAAGGASATASTGYDGPRWAFTKDWEPCASDEVQPTRCVWHARRHGNGLGSSYIQTGSGRIIFIRHHDATILLRPMYGA